MVLDDNPSIVERFKNGLGKTGYVVRGATSVKQANDILSGRGGGEGGNGDVCGMVVDRTLTEGAFAGIAFLAAVCARFPSMPTALMTGDLTDVTIAMAGRAGARVVAEKPVSPSTLVRALESADNWIRVLRSPRAAAIDMLSARSEDLLLATMNRAHARTVLARFGGNKSHTADALGISRSGLDALLRVDDDDGEHGRL